MSGTQQSIMPGLITHYIFGCKVQAKLEDIKLKHDIDEYGQIFAVGTQGPDIFFYYNPWPWKKDDGIYQYGNMLHEQKVGLFFESALRYAGKIAQTPGAGKEASQLTAYLAGYLCHYCLDAEVHPYIFYRSGFVRSGEESTKKFTWYHRRFETGIDSMMRETYPQYNAFPGNHKTVPFICPDIEKMHSKAAMEVHSFTMAKEQVRTSIKDMYTAQYLLKDRSGWKKGLVAAIEKLAGSYPLISSMICPVKCNEGYDYLNLQHTTWALPWDSDSTSTSSFAEMFDRAAEKAAELCTVLDDYMSGRTSLDKTLADIGGRSLTSGLDSGADPEFKYYKCIFEESI